METEIEPQTKRINCLTCQNPFDTRLFVSDDEPPRVIFHFCQPCSDKSRAESEARKAADLKEESDLKWRDLCPVEFRTIAEGGPTDVDRLKKEQPLFEKAMEWKYGKRGLLLLGSTGTCKTRVAWRIIRREFDDNYHKPVAITAHRFGMEAVDRQMNGGFADWFGRLSKTRLLFMDDFGKGKFTEAVEAHLFELVDERTSHHRPMILTTNSDGKMLAARMSADRGEPMIRRLRDYCDVIDFTP